MFGIEILIWFILIVILFVVFNNFLYIRTAASFVLSILISSFLTYIYFQTIITEAAFTFAVVIAVIYALARAIRDKRDDNLTTLSRTATAGGNNAKEVPNEEKGIISQMATNLGLRTEE